MKKIITLLFLGSLISLSVLAESGAIASYTASNLTPELNAIIENAKKECGLNPDQSVKFKNDYILFLNENAKPNANMQALFFLLGVKFRGYMNETQFTKITKMVKEGRLNPPSSKAAIVTTPAAAVKPAPITPANTPSPTQVSTQSNVATIFVQLESFMKITPDKAEQVVPILKDYDQKLGKIKTENPGNAAKVKQLTDELNGQIVPKLKMYMTDEQIGILIVALGMQQNILTGKNISPEQKVILDKVRTQYGLNDVQTMAVILVLVQGKIRGDAITAMSAVNPQQAGQDFITLLQDLDAQLKASLTNDQYLKVKTDIEKLLKGQKL